MRIFDKPVEQALADAAKREGCTALLRAHLKHGHWITDPQRYSDACRSGGILA